MTCFIQYVHHNKNTFNKYLAEFYGSAIPGFKVPMIKRICGGEVFVQNNYTTS